MPAIRVTIGDMPLLLRSLVEGILAGDPQFELRPPAEPHAERRPPMDAGTRDFDVLVVSESAIERTLPGATALDELGIVAIAPDGRDAAVMRLNSHRTRLDASDREGLSQAILDAAGRGPDPGG
jgi:hypothetical protein